MGALKAIHGPKTERLHGGFTFPLIIALPWERFFLFKGVMPLESVSLGRGVIISWGKLQQAGCSFDKPARKG